MNVHESINNEINDDEVCDEASNNLNPAKCTIKRFHARNIRSVRFNKDIVQEKHRELIMLLHMRETKIRTG